MGQDYHEEYHHDLVKLKIRELPSVAARMCRVLNDFPIRVAQRKVMVEEHGISTEISTAGSVFDSVWDENVGSAISCVVGINALFARLIIRDLYKLSEFLATNRNDLYSNTKSASFISAYSSVVSTFFSDKIALQSNSLAWSNPAKLRSELTSEDTIKPTTYSALGFYLNQHTLGIEGRIDTDVYEFCENLAHTDILGQVAVINSISSSEQFQNCTLNVNVTVRDDNGNSVVINKSVVNALNKCITEIYRLLLLVAEMVTDMAHLIDGFSPCARIGAYQIGPEFDDLTDISSFDPTTDTNFQKITLPKASAATNKFKLSRIESTEYEMAFKTNYPLRLEEVSIVDHLDRHISDVGFAVCKTNPSTSNGYATYATERFKLGDNQRIKYVLGSPTSSVLSNAASYFEAKCFPYIRVIAAANSYVATVEITATKV